ncbi:hypothetical protein ACJQWK_00688 [Exserohilum turcicum]|uniref:LysM domain-containing protein n=1 Tax=Exserohilum turcicum (strain 28A) TaxID=671987 RepID=R0IG74_EXST2|nr:uncharacterized protein SETTUDRAFT_119008 [Exserohilum turcica Et28A]EOA84026.1 hypothetical protein SETTUDRAFT_119008 [Exserohilum turcica Et28A]
MNPSNGSSLSTSQSSSTLRPRAKRLISLEDDIYATDGSDSSPSRAASQLGSRNVSPGPHAHAAAAAAPASRMNLTSTPSSFFQRSASGQPPKPSSQTLSGLWGNSWSAIQGIAATVMASDTAPRDVDGPRRRKSAHGRRTSTSAPPPKHWGPAGAGSHVGAGTQEEREAMVRAMKRKDLLTANDHLVPDSAGRMKRRNSDDQVSISAPPGENDDRDALVYIHHVRPQDTLAGLSIKYNCDQAVLRKANRMWPNDTIQFKKEVVLPVDACGTKGRPVQGPDALPAEDLLLGEYADSSNSKDRAANTEGLPNGWNTPRKKDQETTSVHSADTERPWKHDSWVLLPNDKSPTEIARMPRRALGFFPPARRKSQVYSDASTPRPSVDVPRSSTSTNPIASSPSQYVRPRASSNLSSVSAHGRQRSTSGRAWALHGPGGVGTLGRNVRSPGPAQDSLNKKFAQYLPNVAPPPDQEYFTPWAPSLLDAGAGTPSQQGGSGAITPLSGSGLDFQELGGAIEGWMRKVGTQVQKLLNEPGTPGQGKRSAVPVIGSVGGDLGDLIELQDDAFEIGDEERNRGRSRAEETLASTNERSTSRSAQQYQSARPDINLVLRERTRKSQGSKRD